MSHDGTMVGYDRGTCSRQKIWRRVLVKLRDDGGGGGTVGQPLTAADRPWTVVVRVEGGNLDIRWFRGFNSLSIR